MTSVLTSLNAVRIFVADLERARQFYGDTLGLVETNAGATYTVYDVGNVAVVVETVAEEETERDSLIGRFLAVSFNVAEDIQAAYDRLSEAGVEFLQPPEAQPWGGTLAFFRDPDGNVLTMIG